MELWIRSQDRTRLQGLSNRLIVQETSINPHSHWWGIMIDSITIAEYNSEERALEILDEIQRKLDYIYDSSLRPRVFTTIEHKIVYEMPKE